VWAAWTVAQALKGQRNAGPSARDRALQIMATFAPGIASAAADPRAFLIWQPLASTARQLDPEAFGLLDQAAGGTFPFTTDQVQAAHARWSTDWLAWERMHDGEYKLKAAMAESVGGVRLDENSSGVRLQPDDRLIRARVEAVEREKLDIYQRRYEEYVRVSKALQALTKT
jgi:hypothetical protein